MSASWAYPGCKCVCVRKSRRHRSISIWKWVAALWAGAMPKIGCTYTIVEAGFDVEDKAVFIRLRGFPFWHPAHNFRPLVSATKTQAEDIALIKSLLNPAHEDAV